jgi:hypothetical protein
MIKSRGEKKQDALLNGGFRYCGVAAAMIGSAVVGAAVSSNASSKASKAQANSTREASNAQLQAQRESIEFQQAQADQARADREPWRQEGVNSLSQLSARIAPGGDLMRTFGMSDFQKDPGYQFRLDEGMKGLNNSAAARGGLLSGAALKEASQYTQNFASNEFGNASNRFVANQTNQFNRLASLADVGQTAANQNGQTSMQLGQNVGDGMRSTANIIGSNMIGAGNARASGYIAQGNALTNGLNQGVSAWNQYNNANNNRLYNSLNNFGGGYNSDGTFSPNTYGSSDTSYNRAGATPDVWD